MSTGMKEELIKLKELLNAGILTNDEFEEQKKKILNQTFNIKNNTEDKITMSNNSQNILKEDGFSMVGIVVIIILAIIVCISVFWLFGYQIPKEKQFITEVNASIDDLKSTQNTVEIIDSGFNEFVKNKDYTNVKACFSDSVINEKVEVIRKEMDEYQKKLDKFKGIYWSSEAKSKYSGLENTYNNYILWYNKFVKGRTEFGNEYYNSEVDEYISQLNSIGSSLSSDINSIFKS